MSPSGLSFLTDENVAPGVVSFLRAQGHDVWDVKEQGRIGTSDETLIDIGLREKRFVISHDSDFGRLAFAARKPCYGIIFLRLRDQRSENAISVLSRFLASPSRLTAGTINVLRDASARVRRL